MSAAPSAAAAPALSPGSRLRSILGGTVGNLVEWYDWYVYSAFSLYFAGTFFPAEDPTSQLLSAAAVFAVGFLMRPIGGWLLGRHADRHGRKSALTLSVLLMCGGSLLIACTPGSLTRRSPAPEATAKAEVVVRKGEKLALRDFAKRLAEDFGYAHEALCEQPGEYALRGGILDVYPLNAQMPVRIDLFGDVVESLRPFDPATQRTEQLGWRDASSMWR